MTNVTRKTTNKFTKGLVMDFSPENTKNEVLTNALNATLLTFNGNELSLLNDMGNVRVESAFLPEGFIPVGTCEYGGIIYIVSYNPLEDKSLIGCFPSPERNVSRDELGEPNIQLTKDYFQGEDGEIKHNTQCVLLKSNNLNPGDKFVITANESIYDECLADLYENDSTKENPILALNIVSIEDSGKIVYLNSSVRQYSNTKGEKDYEYHILGTGNAVLSNNIDDYRNVLSSGYNVFKSKTSGKLAILAELIMIDTYSVTHSVKKTEEANTFDIIIHTEVSPNVTSDNFATVPKLRYYYLKKSEGYLQRAEKKIPMESDDFFKTKLSDIYVDLTDNNLFEDDAPLDENNFDFPKYNTYHGPESGFIPQDPSSMENYLSYADVKLASITLPDVLADNGIDLPFKYDYTLVPCMSYGKLDHLAVSNTVSFDKLHDFNNSNFNVWKYKISDGLLRLTCGAEIFDTYENHKVDGLILEFYDCWGFAGSIEITDKKSYSGVFTKIISLNTINAISKKRVVNNEYKETEFTRNIDILPDGNGYKYRESSVLFDSNKGWYEIKEGKSIYLENNDCGTLYSNIIYGVKTYLRRSAATDQPYIKKRDFFLYTLPIFNDYYYTTDDFSAIENPELDFVLTYKLENDGKDIKSEYSGEGFTNGYDENDNSIINQYLSGNYLNTEPINVTKYYQYNGTSKLYLEMGLKKDYEELNITYNPDINDKFSCTLQLLNDEGESGFSVNEELLNYKEGNNFINTLNFGGSNKLDGIRKYNFLNGYKEVPIEINYNFIVGYKVNISNIRETQVPATTVCALCHKREDGTYNYEDFGIYVKQINDLEDYLYLSDAMFYNSGNNEELNFGLCRLVDVTGNVETLCQEYATRTVENSDIQTPGRLNTGQPLNELCDFIGKLSFCQPHIHGISEDCFLNIKDNELILTGTSSFDLNLLSNPYYTMTAVTQDTINYNSLYMTIFNHRYILKEGAFTGELLSKFNKAMLETMKHVYVYNPDYDSLKTNLGEVTLQNYSPSFTSNIVSSEAKLDLDNINDFIKFGPIKVSDYLDNLSNHSEITTYIQDSKGTKIYKESITFKPNLLYCGEDNYLITDLTYNTPIPKELLEELEFTSLENTIIKHENGENTQIKGLPDRKILYGFKDNSLINLDVSVYSINEEGVLSINDKVSHNLVKTLSINHKDLLFKGTFKQDLHFNDRFDESVIVKSLKPELSKEDVEECGYFYNTENDCLYVSFLYIVGKPLTLNIHLVIDNIPDNSYTAEVNKIKCLYEVVEFYSNNDGSIMSTSLSAVDEFFNEDYKPTSPDVFKAGTVNSTRSVKTNGFSFDLLPPENSYTYTRTIYKIKNLTISYKLTRIVDISNLKGPFINIPKTDIWSLHNKQGLIYSDGLLYEVFLNNSLLKYSTITLNDLLYIPNLEGHRLFIKPYNYNRSVSKIIYRSKGSFNVSNPSVNTLVLFCGPGYQPVNE